MTATVCFPGGNLAPAGSVIKSTAIDPAVVDADGVYRHTGPARVFTTEREAIAALKGLAGAPVEAGDVVVLAGRGPLGSGLEETYQLTSALRYLPFGKRVALVTDARFSGVSTGACVGHVSPEALAGGPLGRLVDGDRVRILVDREHLTASIDLVGHGDERWDEVAAAAILAARPLNPAIRRDPDLPADTRLWAALQAASGGLWGGCVYDPDAIVALLDSATAPAPG